MKVDDRIFKRLESQAFEIVSLNTAVSDLRRQVKKLQRELRNHIDDVDHPHEA